MFLLNISIGSFHAVICALISFIGVHIDYSTPVEQKIHDTVLVLQRYIFVTNYFVDISNPVQEKYMMNFQLTKSH